MCQYIVTGWQTEGPAFVVDWVAGPCPWSMFPFHTLLDYMCVISSAYTFTLTNKTTASLGLAYLTLLATIAAKLAAPEKQNKLEKYAY